MGGAEEKTPGQVSECGLVLLLLPYMLRDPTSSLLTLFLRLHNPGCGETPAWKDPAHALAHLPAVFESSRVCAVVWVERLPQELEPASSTDPSSPSRSPGPVSAAWTYVVLRLSPSFLPKTRFNYQWATSHPTLPAQSVS